MKIKKAILKFITGKKFSKRDAEKLRGFFGTIYKEEDLFHNHEQNGKSIYRMPLIQYKILDGNLTIIGINQGVPVLADKFLKVDKITLGDETLSHFESQISVNEDDFYIDDNLHEYKLESIWLPLNQKNYQEYINKTLDLNIVLRNNILSNFKGCGINADKKIMVKGNFYKKRVVMDDNNLIGFTGSFVSNVVMPEHLGVGKMRAVGFGNVVRKID